MHMTTTRTLHSYGPDDIYLKGLTRGPSAGWRWDGAVLSHPLGIRLQMAPEAAQRITAAIAAYQPPTVERLTGFQVSQLPEAERSAYELEVTGWGEDPQDNEHCWWYVRRTDPVAGECTIDVTEVIATEKLGR